MILLTSATRFAILLEVFIAKRIISQRRCQRNQLNPLKNHRWEANENQHSSYHKVL